MPTTTQTQPQPQTHTHASVHASAAGTWTLGDLTVNRVGFGSMRLPQTGEALVEHAVPRDRDQAIAVLRRAVELGVNHIDTAAFYFSSLRSANELINSALASPTGRYPDDLVITTKVGPARDASGAWAEHARTPRALRAQVEENLRQLGRDHLDVVNLRVLGTDSVAERFGALAELREAGLIRHLGLSNITPEHLAEARRIAPVVCVQNMYGIGVRPEYADFVRDCGKQGIAFVPFYAIAAAGRESGAKAAEPEEVLAVARAHDASPAQIRLAWTLHQGPHLLAIPGTGDLAHLAANVAAGAIALTADELALLDAAHRRTAA
ncbi:aldo/keto reductase [Streptomyces sp. NPDC101160]|uniref:aldo/keto reductase n=1 Tax=Streptomyces sp. NPDC101160 TaxID=3366118 RepID=UPI003805DD7A